MKGRTKTTTTTCTNNTTMVTGTVTVTLIIEAKDIEHCTCAYSSEYAGVNASHEFGTPNSTVTTTTTTTTNTITITSSSFLFLPSGLIVKNDLTLLS
ncbi:hypothetical protein M0802_005489 [Mischocyttarus mexicanus]|nr:hypothetical protein M0802_005489 [Mischocyttarus mexicanus]